MRRHNLTEKFYDYLTAAVSVHCVNLCIRTIGCIQYVVQVVIIRVD